MALSGDPTDAPEFERELPEVRPRARNRATKRWLVRLIVVTTVWYAGIYVFLPSISCGPTSVLVGMARRALVEHANYVCTRGEIFGDFRESQAMTRLLTARRLGNQYSVTLLHEQDESGSILVLYPRKHQKYRYNLLYRVLFWDGATNSFPTFALKSIGDLFDNNSSHFDSRHPPTDAVLQSFGEEHGWSFERRLSLTPPCD